MNIDYLKSQLNNAIAADTSKDKALLCRKVLISAIDFVYQKQDAEKPAHASLLELIEGDVVPVYIPHEDLIKAMNYVRIVGKHAEHDKAIRPKEAKLAINNMSALVDYLDAREQGAASDYITPSYMTEDETRKQYVDQFLKEAGWEVLEKEDVALPSKAGIEIKVQGMPNQDGYGYCDYVLYGKDGRPLAIVEVKKTSKDPSIGRHQVDLYAECMKAVYGYKPVMYYTNGYNTKIIDGIYPDRDVYAFHSLEDLERIMLRRKRGDIVDFTINKEITGRPYQIMGITNLCEWLNANHRRGLLVMATGTGKTRVAISLVDILARNNWVKNVLFLADRTSLVNQAFRNFKALMPNMTACELNADKDPDYNARLMFSTYQTMINFIDKDEKQFTTGRFDLIIIDEAHRSIFNKYGSIFKYFDSLLVGLTATPKNEVDANTYQIFGCEAGMPNYDYSLEQAIQEHYLVGYNVINRTSKILTEGINIAKLPKDQQDQFKLYLAEKQKQALIDPSAVPGSEIFRYLFNKDTCRKVIEDVVENCLRVDGGETIGKTIIFAYNHEHAQMIVDAFNEVYPEMAKKSSNTCQLVDYSVNYAEDLVIKFGTDDDFRIAVSVDMLDTGIDVPAVQNLVFFKPVRSKIKFMQMIGRGTRLCENLLGPGKDKKGFLIFDYCANFEYFEMHVDGAVPKDEHDSLSQRLFKTRLDMLYSLQKLEYQQDSWYKTYYTSIKKDLHEVVIHVKNRSNSMMVRQALKYVDKFYDIKSWQSLSPVGVEELKQHIAPLLESGVNGDPKEVAFDVRMYRIESELLKHDGVGNSTSDIKVVRQIAKYLLDEKASVTAVLNEANNLKLLMSDTFWIAPKVPELERLRAIVRKLMPYLDFKKKGKFSIDITDEITPGAEVGTEIDIRTYKEKVIDYLAANSDNPVIQKIAHLEPITVEDLNVLEQVLWHELGTKEQYHDTTEQENLAAFVRSLIGLSQEVVNEKFGEYLTGNIFNSMQQEFIQTIINYVRENGDIQVEDMVNNEPFNNYNLYEMFGDTLPTVVSIVNVLHGSIVAA